MKPQPQTLAPAAAPALAQVASHHQTSTAAPPAAAGAAAPKTLQNTPHPQSTAADDSAAAAADGVDGPAADDGQTSHHTSQTAAAAAAAAATAPKPIPEDSHTVQAGSSARLNKADAATAAVMYLNKADAMTTEAANANEHDYENGYVVVVVVGSAFAYEAVWAGTKTEGYASAEAVVGDTQIQAGTTQAPESPEGKTEALPHGTRVSTTTTS